LPVRGFSSSAAGRYAQAGVVLARIDVCLHMPAGQRVTVGVRSRSSRRASAVEASVTMDGVTVLNESWAGHDMVKETVRPDSNCPQGLAPAPARDHTSTR
jgi:hypothetical protein